MTNTNMKLNNGPSNLDLGNLGKPTMRGIRKCPKCGTFNGTRGLSCKNKQCDMIFKEAETRLRTKAPCECVKLVTGSQANIFSVRLREKGPDYRGFVQLPTVQGLQPGESIQGETAALVQANSQCLVENCGSPEQQPCQHITSCLLAQPWVNALPLMLRHSAMNQLEISQDTKAEVYRTAEQTSGPLVQRLSKNVFAVKCSPCPLHPLGYLHMCFMEQRTASAGPARGEHRFFCTCSTFRGEEGQSGWSQGVRRREQAWKLRRCKHFYSCLAAFASDSKLAEEFKVYLSLDREIRERNSEQEQHQGNNQVIAILGHDENGDTVQVEVLNTEETVLDPNLLHSEDIQIEMETPDGRVETLTVPASSIAEGVVGGFSHNTDTQGQNTSRKRYSSGTVRASVSPPKSLRGLSSDGGLLPPGGQEAQSEEASVSFSFSSWLASVTERINQTMHYQFDGHPEPLVFHAPQIFFNCLRERISLGSKKKRLPNSTTAFVRQNALPLGTFTKYSWSIINILQVKQIFDTHHQSLNVSRSFTENKDGTFSLKEDDPLDNCDSLHVPGKQRIRAHELRTFLKVGHTLPDQKEPTPFIIEWIPDILPSMQIGELRIKFEYGHQRNGHLEQRLSIDNGNIRQSSVNSASSILTKSMK